MLRTLAPKMTAKQLQNELLKTIRAEYEHNLSQQIYVSTAAWKITKSAKENLTKLVNSIASVLKEDATAFDLSKAVLESVVKNQIAPTTAAIEYLKNEMRQIFIK